MTTQDWGGLLLVGSALLGLWQWYRANRTEINKDLEEGCEDSNDGVK